MENPNICCLCLARDDLLRITKEKERLINSVLQRELSKDEISRICINCSSLLSYLGKFQKASQTTQNILKEQKTPFQHQKNFFDLPSSTQDKVSDAFDVVLNWLTGVNVILEHHSTTQIHEISNNTISSERSADTMIIKTVHDKEFLPEISKDQREHLNTKIVKEEYDYGVESSSDESEEPTIEMFDKNSEMQEQLQVEELNEDELDKCRTKINGRTHYKCPICKKTYSLRAKLKYHMNLHKGIKPYKCIVKECSKTYFSPNAAQIHYKIKHNINVSSSKRTTKKSNSRESEVERIPEILLTEQIIQDDDDDEFDKYCTVINGTSRYKCPECKYSFPGRKKIKYHMNLHKGTKPYKCIVQGCSKAYYSPYMAAKHCKESHKINVDVTRWTGINKKWENRYKSRKTSI